MLYASHICLVLGGAAAAPKQCLIQWLVFDSIFVTAVQLSAGFRNHCDVQACLESAVTGYFGLHAIHVMECALCAATS